jgi:hypothetical protein
MTFRQRLIITSLFVGASLAELLLSSGCVAVPVDSRHRATAAQVRDVPFEARETDEMRKKVLVLPFLDTELQRSNNVKDVARKTVIDELNDTRNFIVVNTGDLPQDVGAFVKENKEYDVVALSRMASNMGISAIVEGRIVDIRARRMGDEIGLFRKIRAQVDVAVQVRVFAAKTGREIYNGMKKATVESETTRVGDSAYSDRDLQDDPTLVRVGVKKAFRDAMGGIVKSVEKLSWEGRVAMVSGEKIYINSGRLTGIQVGDILKITEEGNEIFDPETGAFIGAAPGRMKGTIEVVSYFGKDGSIAIVHSGSGFKENDHVEIY